ncbi:MAG: lytic transglycosylase domain-containing protein, partial [Spirochaetota bacterium]
MKLVKLKYIGLIILVIILFTPFIIHSQSKKIINLSDDEVNKWLGIESNNEEEDSSNPYASSENYFGDSENSDDDDTIDGDKRAFSSHTEYNDNSESDDNGEYEQRDSYKASSIPFFKGINKIRPTRNKLIDSYIEYFTEDKKGRVWIQKSFEHFEFYFPVFRSQLKFGGLPLELMVIPFIETGYNNEVRSSSNKAGLWQLSEEQAVKYNLEINEYIDERKDFEKATHAAVTELNTLYNTFKDWNLTIMAWALGESKVIEAINRTGTKDCWKIYAEGGFGDSKRRAFLAHFYALLDILVNAEHYGFEPPRFIKGIPYYKVILNKAVELRRIEKDLHLVKGIMYAYNPQLKKRMSPPNYKDFLLKYPADPSIKRDFEIQAAIYNTMPEKVVKHNPEESYPQSTPMEKNQEEEEEEEELPDGLSYYSEDK